MEVPMKVIITKDYDHLSRVSSDVVIKLVHDKPDLAFCAPTGSTPIGMYKVLVEKAKLQEVDFSKTKVCNMDEYVGLAPTHDQSYNYFLRHHFLDHINFDQDNSVFVNALAFDKEEECRRYTKALDNLNVDLAIDGIGLNGHLAFNEPADFQTARTHVADLSQNTIDANSRFFDDINDVPKQAYSIGLADLMMAKHLLILASGKHKAEVIARLFSDDLISTQFPVSFLKLHPNCTLVLDQDSASLLDFEKLNKLPIKLEVIHLDN